LQQGPLGPICLREIISYRNSWLLELLAIGEATAAVGGSDFEVGDSPYAASQALVDAGVAVGAVEGFVVGSAFDLGQAGDDGDVADELDAGVVDVEPGKFELAIAHVIELLGLGEDLAAGVDAEVVVGEQLIHGGNVVGESRLLPFMLEGDDLGALDMLVFAVPTILRGGERKGGHQERGRDHNQHAHWHPAQHGRTGC
jgi:hypothetical protein